MPATLRGAWRTFKMLLKARSFLPVSCLPAYRRLLVGDDRRLVPLQVRTLGGRTVFARPRTADAATLSSVYRDRYHLPPRELPAAPVILDLGCNCGYTIVHYKHLYPDARVVGVEMDADNVAVARRNLDGLPDVDLVHAAVSARDGVVSYDTGAGEDAYRVATVVPGDGGRATTVPAVSPASLLRRFGLTRVDFAKIDIEGEEAGLFDAAGDLAWLDAVHSLNLEVHAEQPAFGPLLATLTRCGFTAWKDDHHWSAIMAVRPHVPTRGGRLAPDRGSP